MTYKETTDWMFAQLAMYQNQGKAAYKEDLSNITTLAKHLNNPHKKIKTIHVGGTNGKGSTSHMIASILQEAGYKVGLYTSPHLKSFTERIRINGSEISEEAVVEFIADNKFFFEQHQLSFFEMTVGMAFDFFEKQKVDIAIIEVGLGGRLDATNIITPEVSVITNIGLDHTQILGDTLVKIANEKAGIIKKDIPVIIGERQPNIEEVFIRKASREGAEIHFADENAVAQLKTDLLGEYQKKNLKTAITVVQHLKAFKVLKSNIEKGLQNVIKNTNLKGRWQILQEKPKVICDTGHNKEGLTHVIRQLLQEKYRTLHIVMGVVSDKKMEEILPLFPKDAKYYFCTPNILRGLASEKLKEQASRYGLLGIHYDSVIQSYNKALKTAENNDVIFVGGSTFTVAEIL